MNSLLNLSLLAILVSLKCILPFVCTAFLSIDTDKEGLIAFRSQISLESPNPLSSWDQNSSPCNWTGVSCNSFGHRVVSLNLSGMGLIGPISPFIGNLSFLRSLQLQSNQLTGTIPGQITNLFRLQVLNMSFNSLQGSIPRNISKLVELRVLDLAMNRITGNLPDDLSVLAKLQDLHLARNLFLGAIPPSMANISSLVTLNLGTNYLTGRIPSDLSHLQNLKVLDLTINSLTGTVPASIYNMSMLVTLALASNFLSGTIPSDVGDTLPNLLVFNFCVNNFTGNIPGSLHNLTNMEVIRMARNLLEGTVPPGLENLPFLRMYNIGYNKIVSSGEEGLGFLTLLTNSTRLNFLAIDGNRLEGKIPDSVGNLSKVLQKLYMGGNQIHSRIPNSIGQLSSLTLLDLGYNAIDGLIPPEIRLLKDLQVLVLAGNWLSGIIPDSLGNLQKLNRIDLSGNELVGQIPTNLENMQSLLSMDLSNNRLNGSIPKEIFLPSLTTILNLSNNFLSENLPQEIGNLENIVAIDFSNNSLQGDIPSSIRDCKSLEELYLAWNGFSGSIPGTLAEVKALKTLDLSHNRLSGSIPPELQNLQVLQSLNLSFNDLEGLIPRGGVFRNQSMVRLEGNPKLCLACGQKSQSLRKGLIKVSIAVSVMAMLVLCSSIGSVFYLRKRRTKAGARPDSLNGQHQIVPYNELRQATQDFNTENLIGSGSFGSVYKGYNVRDHSIVAVKVLDTKKTGSWKSFLAECEALKNTRHRNLVKLITSCSSMDFKNNEFLALVYEFLGNGSLDDWLRGKRKKENGEGLNLVERLNVAIDVASVLDYLHHDCEVPVIHCDLKPSNVLLGDDMTAKVGDFGLARLLAEKIGDNHQASLSSTHVLKGSIGYIPPEYGLGVKPSTAGDTYSFGVMLLELFTGKSPCDESLLGEQNLAIWVQSAFCTNVLQLMDPELLQLMNNHCLINPEIQDCFIKIMKVGLSCTVGNPSCRISIRDALYKLKDIKKKLPCWASGEKTNHLYI